MGIFVAVFLFFCIICIFVMLKVRRKLCSDKTKIFTWSNDLIGTFRVLFSFFLALKLRSQFWNWQCYSGHEANLAGDNIVILVTETILGLRCHCYPCREANLADKTLLSWLQRQSWLRCHYYLGHKSKSWWRWHCRTWSWDKPWWRWHCYLGYKANLDEDDIALTGHKGDLGHNPVPSHCCVPVMNKQTAFFFPSFIQDASRASASETSLNIMSLLLQHQSSSSFPHGWPKAESGTLINNHIIIIS